MTVGETMALQARLFGMEKREAIEATERLLSRVGLIDRMSAFTSTLSGGMKRRLEVVRALLPAPALLILDEPTLALDPDSRRALWAELLEVNASGVTLLLATNEVDEAERYCTSIAMLDQGRLVVDGTPADLKRGLRHDAVRIEWQRGAAARADMLRTWEGVGGVRLADTTTHVTIDAATPFLARLFDACGNDIRSVRIDEASLEDVYFQYVGHGIAGTTT
jgi:ABC-2 type transport system ATP-binding protein